MLLRSTFVKKIIFLIVSFTLFIICIAGFVFYKRTANYSISLKGKLFVVNKLSSSISIIDLVTGDEIKELPLDTKPREITATSNQNFVVTTNYGDDEIPGKSISVIDTKTHEEIKRIILKEGFRPFGITSLNHQNKVAIATNSGSKFLIIDIDKNEIETIIPTNQKTSHMLVLHPLEPLAYVTNRNSGTVSVINYKTNQIVETIKCDRETDGIAVTPDGKEVWVTNLANNLISVIDTETNLVTKTIKSGKQSFRLNFSLDGKLCIVTNAKDGTISIYDRFTKEKIKVITLHGKTNFLERFMYHTPRPMGIAMHPNGRHVFIANSNADKVEVLDLKTFNIVSNIGTGRVPDGMAIIDF